MNADQRANSQSFRVTFIPDVDKVGVNPYWTILKKGLEASGAQFVTPEDKMMRWLWQTRDQPTVIHLHGVRQFYAYEHHFARLRWVIRMARNLWLARLWGHRVIFTLHDLTQNYPLQPEWVDKLGHRLAYGLADSVIIHCEAARELLAEAYDRRNDVFVVPHPHYVGVYPDSVSRNEARAALGFDTYEVVLAFVGIVRPNKGVDRLVRVFKQCDDPRLRLLIAGSPAPPMELIEAIRTAAVEDPRIHLNLGHIPDEDMQLYYRAADAIVLPFSWALTSSSVILALSYGRPVIVPRMGCLVELPDGVAIQYEPDSDEGLLNVFVAIADGRLSTMDVRVQDIAEIFSLERFIEGTVAAYTGRTLSEVKPSHSL